MDNFKYNLARKGKNFCPACKHKTYVLYLDNSTGKPLHSTVGKCDRADNCGHHYSPKEYFRDNSIHFDASIHPTKVNLLSINSKPQPSYIDENIFRKSLHGYENNQFAKWLSGVVGKEKAVEEVRRYSVGTAKNGGTVFWQIDRQGKVRSGKIIQYDSNGHRRKDVTPPVQWVHSLLKLPNYNLKQCFFGENLLRDLTKMVAIVESEKTAIIASIYLPDSIWLACGGSEGLSIDKCQVLKGRDVVLYPDCGMFNKWSEKAKELSKICNVRVSDLIETKATDTERQAGYDIADYLIRFPLSDFAEQKITESSQNKQMVNLDAKLFVEAILLTAKSNNGNPAFRPYLDRLITFKNKLSTWMNIKERPRIEFLINKI